MKTLEEAFDEFREARKNFMDAVVDIFKSDFKFLVSKFRMLRRK